MQTETHSEKFSNSSVSILSIGNEILNGSTINTNVSIIGRKLHEFGIEPELQLTVPDTKNHITLALEMLTQKAGLIISTGGLGPTSDDITKATIAEFFNLQLQRDKQIEEKIRNYWLKRGRKDIPPSVFNQADIIENSELIPNDVGTAPGFIIRDKKKSVIMMILPGPPSEMTPMLNAKIATLINEAGIKSLHCKLLLTSGIPESVVEELTEQVIKQYQPSITPAYCAAPDLVRIYLKSYDEKILQLTADQLAKKLSFNLIHPPYQNIYSELIAILAEKNETLALAESCTGGLFSKKITDQPGSSKVFTGAIISYANKIKINELNVNPETIEKFGAVSEKCAREMLIGIQKKFNVHSAVSITGIAGPEGGTTEKPVGTVFIGTSYNKFCEIRKYSFSGSREIIRERAVASAANQLKQLILSHRSNQ